MTELLIHDEWVPADGSSIHELIDPATRRLLEPIRCASSAQRQRALEAARAALNGWMTRAADDRAVLIHAIVDEIRQAAGALAERQAIESGQPLRECQDLVANAIRRLRATAGANQQPLGTRSHGAPGSRVPPIGLSDALAGLGHAPADDQAPRGVPSYLAPNRAFPSAHARVLPRHSLWPFWVEVLGSIAAGSTVVCELPADRALTALAIGHYAHRLPPGVLNVVTIEPAANKFCDPTTSGQATAAGKATAPGQLAAADRATASRQPAAADAATDFVFVGQDADLDFAVAGATALRLYNTGQRPGQSARIYVAAPVAYRFADRLHEYLAFLEAGDPRKPITDLGPLHGEAALHRATEQIGDALKRGALVKLGGRTYQPWGLRGYYLQPTLLVEGTAEERVPHESISGPVVIVSPTTDIGSALREGQNPRRLAAFTGQHEKLERSLRAASFQPRISAYTPMVERAWKQPDAFELELIEAPQLDWFPYENRRGLKL